MSSADFHRDPPKVPNHDLMKVIGRGSYGEIWLARSLTGTLRAVKIVHRSTFDSEKSFQREFEGMARFEPISREHEGFIDILHVGRDQAGGFFYYVMELADDHIQGPLIDPEHYIPKTLKSELGRRKRLLADECVALGLSLTEALAALHCAGLVHRDIKPANVIFVGGRPKIADIGLVAATGQDSFVGTEGYVPPEGPGAAQADIYSLGKVLYEMAMGKDRMDFPALDTRLDSLPDKETLLRLNELLLCACATDLNERYQRAEQMLEDLARIRDGRPLHARARRRNRFIAVGLIIAIAAPGAWFARQKLARGTVTIETDPPGAMLVLDEQMKRSPAKYDQLKIGAHTVRVMMPDHEPLVKTFHVEPNKDLTLPRLILKPFRGALAIACPQAGSTFELRLGDEVVRTGTFPAKLDGLLAGEYTLVARFEGREKRAQVNVVRDETATRDVLFASGKVRVASQPEGATILVDGKDAGATPCELSLPEGDHELIAKYGRWPEQHRTVKIVANLPGDARFDFAPGSVKITSSPGGATILSKGKELGHTPLLVENVEPGPARYELHLPGYQPVTESVEVQPGEQAFIGARFAKRLGPQRGLPWENSLGMKFVPVADVLMEVWPVRVQDYDAFCQTGNRKRPLPDFAQDGTHPVVLVNWDDAAAFCEWLTQKEFAAGQLADGQQYRLPTDAEWSRAVGLPEEGGASPQDRDGKIKEFAWGKQWPPPAGAGNFADQTSRRAGMPGIAGYHDGFSQTSPVGAFAANKLGLFDMTGNVWQWCAEAYRPGSHWGVLRGGSWANANQAELYASCRNVIDRNERDVIYGFRVVLVVELAQ
jgi:formylglycine-generating enzyme required for sulfatase activity